MVIDAHLHLWDTRRLHYEWLQRPENAAINRTYRFENFADAMGAAVRIGEMAEEQEHHPDLHVSWGRLVVEIWTHKIGGLTESDFIFAAKCDILAQAASARGAESSEALRNS